MSTHWFARRHRLGDGRSGMAPVSWQGWAVMAGFGAALFVAAAAGAWFASTRNVVEGFVIFAFLAGVAWMGVLRISNRKGDHIRSVAEYRADAGARADEEVGST